MAEPILMDGWEDIRTTEDLCARLPERVAALLHALDLHREGFEEVRHAAEAGDLVAACDGLIAYFAENGAAWLRRDPDARPGHAEDVNAVLADTFTIQGVTGKVPRREDGGIDWFHRGPRNDHEFPLLFNRHSFFSALLCAWRTTGELKYARAFDWIVRDWVIHNPRAKERTREPNWRCLEVGRRASGSWPAGFFGFYEAEDFTPAARILMLGSFADHAAHLQDHWGHANPNITLMELNGLGHVPALFPEFREGKTWLDTAKREMTRQLGMQVYPDGAQNELTVGYHGVARINFEQFADILTRTGHEAPGAFRETLASMWHYTALVLRPDGHIPMNNDSDRQGLSEQVTAAAEKYGHPEWAYIATNGAEGTRPDDPPSRVFPWAGQLVSRSGWDRDAHWSFFDFGPWGASHQHNDKLHLSVAAGGRDLLVDSGRFAYGGVVAEKFRAPYAKHSAGHNVILIDGEGQGAGPKTVSEPAPEDTYAVTDALDFARGSFDAFEHVDGNVAHFRSVVYVRDGFWVVVDRVVSDRPRQLQALWHFHPACTVQQEGNAVASTDAGVGNVRVQALGNVNWEMRVVKGQETPRLQGWYSKTYNDVQESPCAVFEANVAEETTFAWVIVPGMGTVEAVDAALISVDKDGADVRVGNTTVRVPVTDGQPWVSRA